MRTFLAHVGHAPETNGGTDDDEECDHRLGPAGLSTGGASAATINWADRLKGVTTTVKGNVGLPGAQSIGLTFTGDNLEFVRTNGGTNHFTIRDATTYADGSVDDAPLASDIIALQGGGRKTITFDRTVSDVYMAPVSWNGNSGTFDQRFEVVGSGRGHWGTGSFANVTPASFTGNGELHGVIRFTGNFSSISFTGQNERRHGFQVGIAGPAPVVDAGALPEPASRAMMIGGLGLVGGSMRRRARTTFATA